MSLFNLSQNHYCGMTLLYLPFEVNRHGSLFVQTIALRYPKGYWHY
jgi:hypothetical protein